MTHDHSHMYGCPDEPPYRNDDPGVEPDYEREYEAAYAEEIRAYYAKHSGESK